jgi:cation transport regulator
MSPRRFGTTFRSILREAFNHAFATHAGDPRQEETSRRIASVALERSYFRVGYMWIGKTSKNHY